MSRSHRGVTTTKPASRAARWWKRYLHRLERRRIRWDLDE